MGKLTIKYVQRPPHSAEDLPPDVVELWIGVSGSKVDINIVRRGFILADPVMRAIRERVKHLSVTAANTTGPLPERIGFSSELSPDWYQFFEKLLQRSDSWSFLVSSEIHGRAS
jgi:hypothetical protein